VCDKPPSQLSNLARADATLQEVAEAPSLRQEGKGQRCQSIRGARSWPRTSVVAHVRATPSLHASLGETQHFAGALATGSARRLTAGSTPWRTS
jgi:hypothetical protein